MIPTIVVGLALLLAATATAAGRRLEPPAEHWRDDECDPPSPPEPVEHTGTVGDPVTGELDPATAQWMADLCRAESTITEAVEHSDAWWAAQWRSVDDALAEAVATFGAALYAAVGPELVLAEREREHREFWAIVTRPSPALAELDALATPTGEYPVVDGYQRSELVF